MVDEKENKAEVLRKMKAGELRPKRPPTPEEKNKAEVLRKMTEGKLRPEKPPTPLV